MKQRKFFNLQSITMLVVAFVYLILTAIKMGTGEGFELIRTPTFSKEYALFNLEIGQKMAHIGALVLLFVHFAVLERRGESKKLLLIAMLLEAFGMSPIPNARIILFNVIWELCWIALCTLMVLWICGKLKSRVIPVVACGGLTWFSFFAVFALLVGITSEMVIDLLYGMGALAQYVVILLYFIATLKRRSANNQNEWHCECGHKVDTNYCTYCGRKRP